MVCIAVWGAPLRPWTRRRPPLHWRLRYCFHHPQRNQGSSATATRSASPLACRHLSHCPVRQSHASYLPRVRRRRSPLHCHRWATCWSAARVPTGTARLRSDLTENPHPVSSRYLKTFKKLIIIVPKKRTKKYSIDTVGLKKAQKQLKNSMHLYDCVGFYNCNSVNNDHKLKT